MSTTMPSAPSAARRNVASTTYVAPCSRWAGPNTSPRRLWAIIMWSRTVTLNTALRPVVGDGVAERRQAPRGQARHDAGQLVEARLAGHEHIERGVAQQVEREHQPVRGRAPRAADGGGRRGVGRAPQPVRGRAPRAAGGGQRPDLAGAYLQAVGMERAAQ